VATFCEIARALIAREIIARAREETIIVLDFLGAEN